MRQMPAELIDLNPLELKYAEQVAKAVMERGGMI